MRTDSQKLGIGSAAFLMAIGCNGSTSYLDATGAAGQKEALLGQWLTAIACAVTILVCIAIVLGIARHRGEQNAPGNTDGDTASSSPTRHNISSGLNWIYGGLAITVTILLVTFIGTMTTLNAASHPPSKPALTLDVTAHQWWWEIRYGDMREASLGFVTANEIHLPVNQPVHVRLRSADVIHSFWLPQLAGKTDVIPGQTNEMWLEAKRAGHSRGMCGEYCGLQHAMMSLPVTSESPAEFARWMSARRAGATSPATAAARAGEVVFIRSCGACHAVSGTDALGRIGPDLTHFASRPAIGAGVLANTAPNLGRWIRNAPTIKEGARMPAIPLNDTELAAVVTYLQGLY